MSSSPSAFLLNFFFGGLAASLTKTAMAPIERIQVLLQTQDVNISIQQGKIKKYKGIYNCLTRVIKEEGLFCLWRGNFSNILRYIPTQAFNFAINDSIKLMVCPFNSDKNPWKFFLGSLFAGGIAGASSMIIVYPFDFTRTRLAADIGKNPENREFKGIIDCFQKVYRLEGFKGIYRGVTVSAIMYFFYRAMYFGGYETIKKVFLAKNEARNTLLWKTASALLVTNIAGFLVFPMDTVRRRLMMQSGRKELLYRGTWDCVEKIYVKEGWKAFYKGGLSNVMRGSGSAFILVIYDQFQKIWRKNKYLN